jgi:SAM-dependent methyltransferase
MSNIVRRIIKRLKSGGIVSSAKFAGRFVRSKVTTAVEEARRGIDTEQPAYHRDLGIENPENHSYQAAGYDTFNRAMSHVTVRPGQDVFVDFGSGKGRIVLLAAEHPFRRVIGVEAYEPLHCVAQENVRKSLPGLACQDVQLVLADATQWEIPAAANVLFFYNPFEGAVLAKVWENIGRSLRAAPRPLTVVYVRPEYCFEKQIRWQELLTRKIELPCREGKLAIYETRTPALSPQEKE